MAMKAHPFTVRTGVQFILLMSFPILVYGQITTGTIRGLVTDPDGNAIPNANVAVEEQNTSATIKTRTSTNGEYVVALLQPGMYTISVEATGFARGKHTDVTLNVRQTLQIDFQMALGRVSERVTVVATGAPVLQTASPERGDVLTQRVTEELPLNGRNFSQLAYLVPGTNQGPPGGIRTTGNGNETQRAGAEVIANGGRGSFNDYMIDGIDDRDESVGTVKVFPNLESISEFKVQTSNYGAEFAAGGAVVNVVTRSGSNALHGSAFEFFRNSGLDARQFFDVQQPPFHQNQFGFAIGGAIQKDKTFFFGDYQGLRIHRAQTSVATVPTAAERTGDLSDLSKIIYDPATYDPATNTRQAFNGNVVPSDRISSAAMGLLAYYPLPNLPGTSNNFRYAPLETTAQDQFDARIDHTISASDTFFGRVTYGRANVRWPEAISNGQITPAGYVGSLRNNTAPSGQATWQETHIFGPSMVNQFAVGYTRYSLNSSPVELGLNLASGIGLQGANTEPDASSLPSISISGLAGHSSGFQPEIVPQNTWQVSDTLAYIHGAHSMKYGVGVIKNDFGFFQLRAPAGSLDFNGAYTNNPANPSGTGDAFADFLLGLPHSSIKSVYTQGTPQVFFTEYGVFAQDEWRIHPDLTVDYGLRYDLFTPPVEKHNRQSDFDPSTGQMILAGTNGVSRAILDQRNHDFSPRIGFAYTVTPKTVIRSGYAMYYYNEQGTGSSARLFIAYPFASEFDVSCSATNPCLDLQKGIPGINAVQAQPIAVYIPQADQTSNAQNWNLTIERELSPSMSVSAAYVGTKGTHLFIALDENVAAPGPGPVAPRRPYPAWSTISSWEPRGNSTYNALQLEVKKRHSHGLWFEAGYTWSKSLDYGAGGNSSSGESRLNVQNPRDLSANRGLSNFDSRQRFTFSHIYDLPVGKGHGFLSSANQAEQILLGGWQLRGILTLQSGFPRTLNLATATANTGTFTRPDRICNGNLPAGQQTIERWYDTSCFVDPPIYQFGNAGRNIIIGPGLAEYDFGLTKDFRLTEKLGMTFRSEFFNLFNHPNFGLPDGSIGSRSAGTVTSVITNAREIQFGLRLHW